MEDGVGSVLEGQAEKYLGDEDDVAEHVYTTLRHAVNSKSKIGSVTRISRKLPINLVLCDGECKKDRSLPASISFIE